MVENIARIKSGIMITVCVSVKEKSIVCSKKIHIWNCATCSCQNGKYFESIIGSSVIRCDGIINTEENVSTNVTSNVSTNFYNKK